MQNCNDMTDEKEKDREKSKEEKQKKGMKSDRQRGWKVRRL